MSKSKFYEDEMTITTSSARILTIPLGKGTFKSGDVLTPWGIVSVAEQGHGRTRFDFIANGTLYMRTYNKEFTKTGCARKAAEFAKGISDAY